jgi:hypothetical protein
MPKKATGAKKLKMQHPSRLKLTAEESLRRMKQFSKRKEKFIATIREGKNRSVSA